MDDFSRARVKALNYLLATEGQDLLGQVAVAPWGWEDRHHFQVYVDSPSAIAGDDLASMSDPWFLLVTKATGQVTEIAAVDVADKRAAMTPVGAPIPK